MIGAALGVLMVVVSPEPPSTLDAGLTAYRDGRYEEAARLLDEAMAGAPSYDGLVTLGLAHGKRGRLEEAGAAFDRAIALDRSRPEALVERGGVRFLEKRYGDAVGDLGRALALREDAYTRDLLAASLHLAGRTEEALARWNALGQPVVRSMEITGLVHTRDSVVRREIPLGEGEVLDLGRWREARLRLADLRIFDRITLRSIPLGQGKADFRIALVERHGFYRTLPEFIVTTGANLLARRIQLRYWNLMGEGVSFGGQYRWQRNRPDLSLALDWPRPGGLPLNVRLTGFRGRQSYDLVESLDRRARGLDLQLRRVLGARLTGRAGLRIRDRSFSRLHPDAKTGSFVGVASGADLRVMETGRTRVDGSLDLFQTLGGSDVHFRRGLVSLVGRLSFAPPDGATLDKSALAGQVQWGEQSSQAPIDEMFAPGVSLEMDFPLRAHRQTRNGVLGGTPLVRSLTVANVEWRRRVVRSAYAEAGLVLLYDFGRLSRRAQGSGAASREEMFHDIGLGLRLALPGAPVIRVDFGRGLSDGKNALYAGLNQSF